MKIVTNEKLIRRNSRIGMIATFSGLAILAGGLLISFRSKDQAQFGLAWISLLAGFLLSQVGVYFGNRWGRRPRPDELINQALKGLDDRYALYHYTTPTAHLLVGPVGIWVLLSRHQTGQITYDKGRWRQKRSGCIQVYLRFFAQEGLGRPDLDIPVEVASVQKFLHKKLPDTELPPIQAALVFTNEKAELQTDDAPNPTLPAKELKEFIRKLAKDKPLPTPKAKEIVEALGE
jgi:hypothetical protein